jgi:capsular exopolysaccharide synthesis family protein
VSSWPKGEDYLVTKAEPKSPVSEAYRTLATNVFFLASRQELQVVLMTSSMGGEGKTTTSANLGVALARAGRRVVLVSVDLRRPRLHRFFGLRNDVGLSSALAAEGRLEGAIREPGLPNLRVITSGPTPTHPAELLASQAMADVVQKLRKVSDFVILDAPPVLAVADASVLAPLADGVLVVIDPDHASRSLLTQARNQLDNAGANVIGGVFNNFDPRDGSTYPYYHYRYYGRYEVTTNGSKGRHRVEPERESSLGFEAIPPQG